MSMAKRSVQGWVLAAVICLAACGTTPEPFEYQNTNDVKPGRGVFTGEDGVWTIYRRPMPPDPQTTPSEEEGQEQPGADAVEEDQTTTETSPPDG